MDEHFVGNNADLAKHRATKMATALRKLLSGEYGAALEPVELAFATRPGTHAHGAEHA